MNSVLKLVTWNVNSARARLQRILQFLDSHQPDIVCLQELKCTQDTFPQEAIAELGYGVSIHGQPSWNGVAILSRTDVSDVRTGLDHESRVIAGTACGIRVVNVYVPNGQRIGSEKHAYKMRWLDALAGFLEQERTAHGEFVLTGDFNVAPEDLDVAHPDAWIGTVLCDPLARSKLRGLAETFALSDILRMFVPGPGVYTWWDYRSRGFEWNDGVRIDHFFATPGLAARSVNAWVDVDERGRSQPSDHAPVLMRIRRT